jgi:hypothetical protein
LYFNDSVIVGSVPGGAIELAAQDPQRGMIIYLLDQAPIRYRTLIRSVAPDSTGIPLPGFLDRLTDNRTPFDQLSGGWYVTGKTEAKHRGNTVIVRGKENILNRPIPATSSP